MTECILEDLTRRRLFQFDVNGPRPTFRLRTERIAAAAVRDLDAAALDLLDVAAATFYSDGRISRGGRARADMGADWHRNLRLTIPVRLPDLWGRSDVSASLVAALNFLTGDQFEFRFVKNEVRQTGPGFLDLDPSEGAFRADHHEINFVADGETHFPVPSRHWKLEMETSSWCRISRHRRLRRGKSIWRSILSSGTPGASVISWCQPTAPARSRRTQPNGHGPFCSRQWAAQ